MDQLITTTTGQEVILSRFLGKDASDNLTARLFINDYTPQQVSTTTDFTELTIDGYVAQALASSAWTVEQDPANNRSVAATDFTFSDLATLPNQPVYGVFITDSQNRTLAAVRFSEPQTITATAHSITLTVRWGLQ